MILTLKQLDLAQKKRGILFTLARTHTHTHTHKYTPEIQMEEMKIIDQRVTETMFVPVPHTTITVALVII